LQRTSSLRSEPRRCTVWSLGSLASVSRKLSPVAFASAALRCRSPSGT
jgi:hypothetical protein